MVDGERDTFMDWLRISHELAGRIDRARTGDEWISIAEDMARHGAVTYNGRTYLGYGAVDDNLPRDGSCRRKQIKVNGKYKTVWVSTTGWVS
jgi:hypothetical protein